MGFTPFGRVAPSFQSSGMRCHSPGVVGGGWAPHHGFGNRLEHCQRQQFSAPGKGRSSLLSAPCSAGDGVQQPAPKTAQEITPCRGLKARLQLDGDSEEQGAVCIADAFTHVFSGAGNWLWVPACAEMALCQRLAQAERWRDPSSETMFL